jgi:hypothetical protein
MRTSPAPFLAAYSPFAGQHGNEIPSYRIYDADGDVVAETDNGKPAGQQQADARARPTCAMHSPNRQKRRRPSSTGGRKVTWRRP